MKLNSEKVFNPSALDASIWPRGIDWRPPLITSAIYALEKRESTIIALITKLTSFNENTLGKKSGKTNHAKNNQAINGAPLKVSMKTTETSFIVWKELALPKANKTPRGNPAKIAMTAKTRLTKNPPHNVTLGPPPTNNIKNILGIKSIHPITIALKIAFL